MTRAEARHPFPLRRGASAAALALLLWAAMIVTPALIAPLQATVPGRTQATAALVGHGRLLLTGGRTLIGDHALVVRGFVNGSGDGSEQTVVQLPTTEFVQSPTWLPDGSGFLYVDRRIYTGDQAGDWGGDLWAANADGSNRRRLLAHDLPGADIDGLSLSADGRTLVYGYSRIDLGSDGSYLGQVIQVRQLNLASGQSSVVADEASDPAISPDGRSIVYLDLADADNNSFGLWERDLDGSHPRPLVTVSSGLQAFFTPRFSPDGTTVLFAGVPPAANGPVGRACPALCPLAPAVARADGPAQDIWSVRADGSALTRLTTLEEDQPSAAWSADGRQIAIYASTGLYLLNADGSSLTRLGDGHLHGRLDWFDR